MQKKQFRPISIVIALVYSIVFVLWTPSLYADNRIKLPDLGDSAGTVVTPELEKKLGEAFIRNIRRHVPIAEDPLITEYIQSLGRKIAASSEMPSHPFNFFVVEDNAINAFAGPGGYIGVNAGLIVITESESELASVLAHEIGHVTQRHLQRAIESASQMALPSAAAMLAAVALGVALPGVGPAALIAVQAGQVQQQINFTRSHEAEADRAGILNLAEAGYDPRSMPQFFGRLQSASQYYGQNIPEILLTHPAPVSRISDTAARAEEYPYIQVNSSIEYFLTRGALRVRANPVITSDLYRTLVTESQQGTAEQQAAGRYALALALDTMNRHSEALQICKTLVDSYPDQPWFTLAYAHQLMETGQSAQALTVLGQAEHKFPNRRPVTMEYAEALLNAGRHAEALERLQKDLKQTGPTLLTYDLLSITNGRMGKTSEGFRYRAEYFYLLGQTRDAITQLKQAAKAAVGDQIQMSALEERIKQLEQELKEQKG